MTAWAQKLDRKVGGRRPPLQCIATTLTKQVPGRRPGCLRRESGGL